MEQSLFKLLLDYGGAVAVIGALAVFLYVLRKTNGKDYDKRLRQIEENHLVTIERRLERLEENFLELSNKVSALEQSVANLKENYNELAKKISKKTK